MNPGINLKTIRLTKGFSQQSLADASGISIRTIQRIEKGLSVGSAFTVSALAKTLKIEAKELHTQFSSTKTSMMENQDWVSIMNLSALSVIAIPFSNIFIPFIIYSKNKSRGVNNLYARKILNFQLLWTIATIIAMAILPVVLLLLFKPLKGSSIPLAVPVYFVAVLLNVCITLRIALAINEGSNPFKRVPDIL